MKIGTLVSFNVVTDDSDYASNCFGVESENDWFDIQVYVETTFGEFIKTNTIEIIYHDGRRSNRFFKVVKGVIKKEIDNFYSKKYQYGLSNYQILESSEIKTLAEFKKIKIIPFIKLSQIKQDGFYLDRIYFNGKIFVQKL